ncbi:hypothetical protein ACFSSA_09805 [Luteolibacter algae]|uniref:Uncharacterized protein n=1 Tax=Luteolibacter algae TaxID=454151 RepID=A0ABW5DBG3_9BACT
MSFPIASIDGARPVFMIVMGVFLMIVAWRMAKDLRGWSARLIVGGAFLLGLGYAMLLPMYDAGLIERFHSRATMQDPAAALAWHVVKILVMNCGWLVFGLGVGIHSGLFVVPVAQQVPATEKSKLARTHESVA